MLYILSLLGIFFLVTMSILLFSEGSSFYAFLNIGFSVILVILFLLVRTGKHLLLYSILSISLLQLFFLFLFHSGASDQMAFVWYYLIPLICLFLLGTSLGTLFSVVQILVSLLINSFSDQIPIFIHVATGRIIRISFSYVSVLLFALVFERTRLSTQKRLESAMTELNELAIRDGLTGLYNRRYMDDIILRMVQQCRRAGTTVGFIMADLDYFKNFNDTYGHQAGDDLLSAFSTLLQSLVQRETDYVFRYGGEEFAVLLSYTSVETTDSLAARIIMNTRELLVPHESSPFKQVTVSIGAVTATFPNDADFHAIVRRADEALYEAKKLGRNRFIIKEYPSTLGVL